MRACDCPASVRLHPVANFPRWKSGRGTETKRYVDGQMARRADDKKVRKMKKKEKPVSLAYSLTMLGIEEKGVIEKRERMVVELYIMNPAAQLCSNSNR